MPVSGLGWAGRLLAGHDPDLDTTAVELPLLGRELSLLVLLPGQIRQFVTGGWTEVQSRDCGYTELVSGGLAKLEAKLSQGRLEGLLRSLVPHQMEVTLPRLDTGSVLNLNSSFASLGLASAFGEEADFSGINGGKNLRISSFLQANKFQLEPEPRQRRAGWAGPVVEARVRKVDRVVSLLGRDPRPRPRATRQSQAYQLSFDRQFLYMVRHNPTGLIVYIGRYHHPHHHHHHQ